MKRSIFGVATIGIILSLSTSVAHADWLTYIVRSSGLGWSDGYHAKDQCPACERGHFPIRHSHTFPAWGAAPQHAPYYFEDPAYKAATPVETLPSAPAADADSRIPNPQARYHSRSRYFQALQAEQQGLSPSQSSMQQARRMDQGPPF